MNKVLSHSDGTAGKCQAFLVEAHKSGNHQDPAFAVHMLEGESDRHPTNKYFSKVEWQML